VAQIIILVFTKIFFFNVSSFGVFRCLFFDCFDWLILRRKRRKKSPEASLLEGFMVLANCGLTLFLLRVASGCCRAVWTRTKNINNKETLQHLCPASDDSERICRCQHLPSASQVEALGQKREVGMQQRWWCTCQSSEQKRQCGFSFLLDMLCPLRQRAESSALHCASAAARAPAVERTAVAQAEDPRPPAEELGWIDR